VFSLTREAQARGFDPSRFSFNLPGGRCDVCQGDGTVTVEMQFLADVELVCEECKGTRFKQQILDVRYRGKNVHDVLNMTVREAMTFFREVPKISNRLRVLDDVGLGYLPTRTVCNHSLGGEAQRIKLAAQLSKRTGAKNTLHLRRPTTGLHFDDINKLLTAFRALIEAGGSLLVIEHNLDVIKLPTTSSTLARRWRRRWTGCSNRHSRTDHEIACIVHRQILKGASGETERTRVTRIPV